MELFENAYVTYEILNRKCEMQDLTRVVRHNNLYMYCKQVDFYPVLFSASLSYKSFHTVFNSTRQGCV